VKLGILMLGCALAALPAAAQETTLAQAAEKQKKSRHGDVKVYTEADLRSAGGARVATPPEVAPLTATAQAGGAATAGATEKSEEEQRAEKRADIEKKLQDARARIESLRKAIDQAQLELNDVSNYTYGPRRAQIQKFMDDGKQQIAAQEQAIADLLEQARRAGIPVS